MNKKAKLYKTIVEKFEFEPSLNATNIAISVKDNGIVILGGEVGSYAEKMVAEKLLQKLYGVKGIANELKVNSAISYTQNDIDIIRNALDALKWNFFVPEEQIQVTVEDGVLTLSGQVLHYYQREYAEKAVQNIIGLVGIVNNILVRAEVSVQNVKEEIIKEFERNARINAENIQIEVNGNTVTLKGSVKNFDEDKEAKVAAWSVPGVSRVIDQLSINW